MNKTEIESKKETETDTKKDVDKNEVTPTRNTLMMRALPISKYRDKGRQRQSAKTQKQE